jgi:hypothetical protein
MSLLMVLGIWIAASVVLTPLVGYFLSDAAQRAAARRASKDVDAALPLSHPPQAPGSRP